MNLPFVIIDPRLPAEAKQKLSLHAVLIELPVTGSVYRAISGHPDVYLCRVGDVFVFSPDLPSEWIERLARENIRLRQGQRAPGPVYPDSCRYNGVDAGEIFIHKRGCTDTEVLLLLSGREFIDVAQGYTSCNLIRLPGNRFITGDPGIYAALRAKGYNVFKTDDRGILLPGFSHGFIGGSAGVFRNRLFFTGSLGHYAWGAGLRQFAEDAGHEVAELSDGPLFDGGGLLFATPG